MGYRTRHWLAVAVLVLCIVADFLALRCGLDLKLFWAYLATAITVTGYAIYVSQMYPPPGGTPVKPEPLTWVLFGLLTGTGWLIQVAQGAQAGSWCLGVSAVACFIISRWSFRKFKGDFDFDIVDIGLAVVALALFIAGLFARRDPRLATLAAITAALADLISYGPTFKKAWRQPHEDSITNFSFNCAKCIPALLALQEYSVATTVYLLMLTIVNGGFAVFLWVRRLFVPAPTQAQIH